MNESNTIEAIDKTNLSEQTKFWLSETIGIENYFIEEINQRQYVSAFDYIDKVLIVLSATSIVGAPVGIANASFTLNFFLTTG